MVFTTESGLEFTDVSVMVKDACSCLLRRMKENMRTLRSRSQCSISPLPSGAT